MELTRKHGLNCLELFTTKKNAKTIENDVFKALNDSIDETTYRSIIFQVVKDVQDGMDNKNILENIKKGNIGWKHHSLQQFILEEEEQDNFIINPFSIDEGIFECKCGSKRVYSFSQQKRSCDESPTTFCTCVACKKTWTICL